MSALAEPTTTSGGCGDFDGFAEKQRIGSLWRWRWRWWCLVVQNRRNGVGLTVVVVVNLFVGCQWLGGESSFPLILLPQLPVSISLPHTVSPRSHYVRFIGKGDFLGLGLVLFGFGFHGFTHHLYSGHSQNFDHRIKKINLYF